MKQLHQDKLDKISSILLNEERLYAELEKAVETIKPFYQESIGGSGSVFIKKFINSLIHKEPIDLYEAHCLDESNRESLIVIFRSYVYQAGNCVSYLSENLKI